MREILFRGKTLTNQWVEGLYYKQEAYYGDRELDADIIITSRETLDNDFELEYFVVFSESVGQYTGLTDKNGIKIFEGDIHCNENNNKKFVVKFGHFYDKELLDDMYGWYMEDNWGNRFGLNGSEYEYANIIGNTIDNPELMGE